MTPLMLACKLGCYEVVELLLTNYSQKCSPKYKNSENFSAIHLATKYGHLKIVELFHRVFPDRK